MKSFVYTMNAEKAAQIQRPEVEAVVARFEPLARFDDPFVQAAALSKSPALKTFLISSYAAKVVLVEIDKDVRAQIDQMVIVQ